MPPAALTSSRHSSKPRICAVESLLSLPVCEAVKPMVSVSSARVGVLPASTAATARPDNPKNVALDFIASSWPLAADDSARSAVCATVYVLGKPFRLRLDPDQQSAKSAHRADLGLNS